MTAATSEALGHDALFERNRAWAAVIVRNVVRKLPPSFEAGDLLQEALMEMWKRVLSYDPANARGTPFQAYAYMAVRGACLMSVRRRNWTESSHASLSEPRESAEAPSEPASNAAGPLQILLDRREIGCASDKKYRRRKWLRKQIAKLSPVDAHLIKRAYIDEADLDTLAKLQGVEKAVLARRLSGIVKRLMRAKLRKPVPRIWCQKEKSAMDGIEYSVVIAEMEAKQAKLDLAIAGVDKLKAQRTLMAVAITALKKVMASESAPKAAAAKK